MSDNHYGRSKVLSFLAGCCWVLLLVSSPFKGRAQNISILCTHASTSFRGLSAGGEGSLWVSGSGGTVGRSTDAGLHWTWTRVPGFERTDFRDIEAFDSNTAVIMGIDTPAVILRTTDGGEHWKLVFRDKTPGMFLDAMDFLDTLNGIVVGDPLTNPGSTGANPASPGKETRFFIARTTDGGKHWIPFPWLERPIADSGEGCFASSGSNIHYLQVQQRVTSPYLQPDFMFVGGGIFSRLFEGGSIYNNHPKHLNLLQGATSTGANSIGFGPSRDAVIVGGDFQMDTVSRGNCLYSTDNGINWIAPHTPPHGYRSCVLHLWDKTWLCCGTSGVDISTDGGDNWRLISKESFHVAERFGNGRTVFLAGGKGRIAQLVL